MFRRDFFFRLRAMRRIAFFRGEFLQRAEIFDLAFQLLERIDQRTQPRNFLDISLGALPIRPEIGRSHPRFNCALDFSEAVRRQRNLRNSRTRDFRSSASGMEISVGMSEK